MIGRLLGLLAPAEAAAIRRALWYLVAAAVLQGLALATLLPVLRELFAGGVNWTWLAVLTVAVLSSALVSYSASQRARRVAYRMSYQLHSRIGDHLVKLPLSWFGQRRVGAVGRLVTRHVMDVMGAVGHLLEPLVTAVVGPLVVLLMLVAVDWRLGLAALLVAPLLVVAYWWTGRLVQRTDQASEAAAAEAASRLVEYARQQPMLRAYGRTSARHGWTALDSALRTQHRRARRALRTAMPGLAGFALAIQLAFTVLLVTLATRVTGATMEPATLVFLLVLVVRFTEPARAAAELGAVLRTADGSLARIRQVLATAAVREPDLPRRPPEPSTLEFDRVGVCRGGDWLLREVSLTVPAGTMTAIVGPSGAGKTTLLQLVARFLDPDEGAVRLGGADLRELAVAELMRRLGVVFQDSYLFEGTLADNLRLARPGATDDELRRVASVARVDEIVRRLPAGWQTRVGEGGSTLSGGERQRLELARALLKDASIMLLDEATAALDAVNEAAVAAAVAALAGQRSVLVVAHHLETIRHADQIVVLDAGRVVQQGTHEQLLSQPGRYAELWAHRRAAGRWRMRRQPTAARAASRPEPHHVAPVTAERAGLPAERS